MSYCIILYYVEFIVYIDLKKSSRSKIHATKILDYKLTLQMVIQHYGGTALFCFVCITKYIDNIYINHNCLLYTWLQCRHHLHMHCARWDDCWILVTGQPHVSRVRIDHLGITLLLLIKTEFNFIFACFVCYFLSQIKQI